MTLGAPRASVGAEGLDNLQIAPATGAADTVGTCCDVNTHNQHN